MSTTIVFIHGSGDSGHIWRLQTAYFGAAHARALDLPGHGQRTDTLPDAATVQDYAHAVHEIITQELQLTRPIIAGHSLGGAIALTMALDYPHELAGLILIGTGARLRVHPTLLDNARQMPQQAQQEITALAVAPEHAATMPSALLQEHNPTKPIMLYRDLAACNIFDVMGRLHNISLPTLIICGSEDQLTPAKYSHYLHTQIAGSELHIIPHAGHYVMREQPEACNHAIETWLSRY